jgi:hypothetical protein
MGDLEANLKRYLEMEALLQAFFAAFGYCRYACLPREQRQNGNRPVAACCTQKYYALYDLDHPAFIRLRQAREALYGKPGDHAWPHPVSPCEYHDPGRGCLLATHKSPTCLGFFCREGIDRLRRDYGIQAYDYLGVSCALEWILTGDFTEGQYLEFKDGILAMILKVTQRHRGAPPGTLGP